MLATYISRFHEFMP